MVEDKNEEGQLHIAESRIGTLDLSLLYLKKRDQDPLVKAVLSSIAKAWGVAAERCMDPVGSG
jgi:hypothetical protein